MAMKEIIDFMQELAEEEKLRVCVNRSPLDGMIAGDAIVGGANSMIAGDAIFGGDSGMITSVAGIVLDTLLWLFRLLLRKIFSGNITLIMSGEYKYVSAVLIIQNMNPDKKERLAGRVQNIMRNVNATDVSALAVLVAGNTEVKNQLVQELVGHFHEMNMQVEGH